MIKIRIFFAICLVLTLFDFNLNAQNQKVADSLFQILSNNSNLIDSEKYVLLERIAFHSGTPDKNIEFGNKALEIAKSNNNISWQAQCHMHIGDGYRQKGDLILAISHYLDAAKYYNEIDHQIGISSAYVNLGIVYRKQGNMENAISFYRRAISIFKSNNDSLRLATSLLNVGELYRENENLDSALIYFQRSKIIFRELDYPIGTAYNLGNIGLVLAEKGHYNQAEENINQAIVILEDLGDRYPIAVYQTSLADIYAQRGEYNRALKYAKSSLNIGFEEGLKEQIRDASLKLSELYKSVGNSDQAYSYLKQYITYRDSINNDETIRKMADLRTEYEVAKKQTEVDLLSKQAKLNRIVSWSAVFIIALLLVLTVALLKIYRIKDRAVRIVRQRRRVIAAQRNKLEEVNKTKDRFFSIISHDIRGPISNFQGISKLINVLADSKDVDGLRQLGSMMESSAKEVSALLDNLLEWALTQEGKIPYYPGKVSLQDTCHTNLSIMLNMAMAKNIELKGNLKEEVLVMADKNSVSTIIRNLLSNAIKFTSENGQVDLDIYEEGNEGIIVVRDNGIGITKDKLEDLFSLKGVRSQWGTKGEKGIGLGLTLIHEFVELNKGKIDVESEEGKGTTFKVHLPLYVPEETGIEA